MKYADIFGLGLYDYFVNKKKNAVFYIISFDGRSEENKLVDFFKPFIKKNNFPFVEQKLLDLVKGKVLDVGCGAGRHALYLKNKGFDVVCIDSSKKSIIVCKKRGINNAIHMDIFNNSLTENSFDSILLLGNTIGIGGNIKGVKKLLKICRKLTKKNGFLIFDSRNGEKIWKIKLKYKKYTSDWFNWISIGEEQLHDVIKNTGWKVYKTFNDPKHPILYGAVLKAI